MDIKLKLNLNFVACLNKLREKYGEEFEKINGLHNDNLNFTDFIDNFIDSNNVANATIDPNANGSVKDIRSLLSEIDKPHTKLLSYNKIFIELTKEYGLRVAEEWLESEWNGALYMHDAPSSSLYSYSYFEDETILINYKGKVKLLSFKDLYDIVEEPTVLLNENDKAYCKYTNELTVWDLEKWTKVIRVIQKPKTKDFVFIKGSNGCSQIVTTNHPVITTKGDVEAINVTKDDCITTALPDVSFGFIDELFIAEELYNRNNDAQLVLMGKNVDNSTDLRINGQLSYVNGTNPIPNNIKLDRDFGWLYGMILAEGSIANTNVTIVQNEGTILDEVIRILENLNIGYSISQKKTCKAISIRSRLFRDLLVDVFEFTNGSRNKKLPKNFMEYNKEFLKGIIGGLLDGDGTLMLKSNRRITIRITSRYLLNQVSFIVQLMGYNVRDAKPLFPETKRDNGVGGSFTSTTYLYQIAFTPYNDGETFTSIKILNNVKDYNNKLNGTSSTNKKYTFGYGDVSVSNVDLLAKNSDEYVYDISTESGHFMCNNILSHNCYAYELKDLAEKGLYFLPKTNVSPAKHLTTFAAHLRELIVWVSNRTSGACALPSLFVYSYYFWKKDVDNGYYLKNPEYYRRQFFQQFIFEVNQIHTRITQSAFTNVIVMDRNYITEIFGDRQFPDGTYVIDSIEEIIEHQKVFMEVVEKIRHSVMLTFPVITYSLLYQDGKFVDEDFAKWCNKHNMNWYDANFYIGDTVTNLASCCRMLNDVSKMEKQFQSSIGGSLTEIGSVKVSTINLMRIAIESKGDKDKFIEILKDRVNLNIKVLDRVRHIIKRNIEKGLLPNYSNGVIKLEKQTVTNGLTAMYEAIDELGMIEVDELGNASYTKEGIEFACTIMDTVNEIQDNCDLSYNISLEIIPAESANVKLCKKDNMLFGLDKNFLYSNQWVNLMQKCSIEEKIKLSSVLDRKAGGGQILHINLQGKFASEEQSWNLLNHIANSGVIYFAYNPAISVCENNHGFFGDVCPECGGEKVDEVSRISGYLVPTANYSKERYEEYYKRQWYSLED